MSSPRSGKAYDEKGKEVPWTRHSETDEEMMARHPDDIGSLLPLGYD